MIQTHEIKGAEILYVQDNVDQRGINITKSTLQSLVDSFRALNMKGRVPLKFGHNSEQPMTDGQPALGWVDALWVEGDSLKANFSGVPRAVYDAIKASMYKFVSVEMLQDVQAGTRKLPWVLTAVALLGADQPALGNLADLTALLTSRRQPELRASRKLAFSQQAHFLSTKLEVHQMDENQVKQAIAEALRPVKADFEGKITALTTEHRTALQKKDDELKAQQIDFKMQQVESLFNAAIKSNDIIPAVREKFMALTGIAKDKTRVLDVELKAVEDHIKDNPNPDKKKKEVQTTRLSTEIPEGATNCIAVDFLARCRIREENGKPSDLATYDRAVKHVLSSNKSLATGYFERPHDAYQAEG